MDLKAEIKWIQDELDGVGDMELYNKEIEEALLDIEQGRVHSHEEVGNMIEKWKGK